MIQNIWFEMRTHGHHPGCVMVTNDVADCDCGHNLMERFIKSQSNVDKVESIQRNDGVVICDVIDRLESARAKHPLPTLAALFEEVGEVAKDFNDGNNPRNELIDVATVAIRLCTETWG